jgi:Putative auto-transporter adhesin, head GIN domain
MKKVLLLLVSFFTLTTLLSAQEGNWNSSGWGGKKVRGEGATLKETRNVTGFKGFDSSIGADIFIKQSSVFKVTIEGQKNVLDLLKTELKGEMLKISFEKGYNVHYKEQLKVYIEAPSFEKLSMSGSGNVKAENALTGSKIDIGVSGSGDFILDNIKFSNVDFHISGSGDIAVSGESEKVGFHVSGSGDIKAADLKAQNVECHISGSGSINCNATKSLNALVSGSGDIRYKGKPETLKTKVSGSGDIEAE